MKTDTSVSLRAAKWDMLDLCQHISEAQYNYTLENCIVHFGSGTPLSKLLQFPR